MSFFEWLRTDEFLTPLLMVLAGVGSLGFQAFVRSYLQKQCDVLGKGAISPRLQAASERFSNRRRISWVLTFAGVAWLSLGLVAEALASGF